MSKILYFTSWYEEKNEQRYKELLHCLNKLLLNTKIDKIYLLCEGCSSPITDPKIVPILLNVRPTYSLFFNMMNKVSSPGDVVIMANTDIYVDEANISKTEQIKLNECYALSRWDISPKGDIVHYDRVDTQDIWIFRAPLKTIPAPFCLGKPGCDNRIAKLIKDVSYIITNPSKSIRFYHLHNSGIRNYTRQDQVPGPYELIPTTFLINSPASIPASPLNKNPPLFKSILHIGFPVPPLELAFNKDSESYKFIGWVDYQKKLPQLENIIKREVMIKKYDLIFLQLQNPGILSVRLLRDIKRISPESKIVNWSGDVRAPQPAWYTETGRLIHLTSFSNQTDVDIIEKNGIKAAHLQVGFDNKIYMPGVARKKWPDIVFMGNNYRTHFPLSPFREQMVNFLKKKYPTQFGVYGSGWNGVNLMDKPLDEADCYKGCKIAINLSHFDYKRFSSDRIFRIMGSGAFCLTKVYPEMEIDFKVGEHLDVWSTLPELEERINFYLNNPDERKRIAQNGCELAHSKHTWKNRLEELKTLL